jgi:hypothetical protein
MVHDDDEDIEGPAKPEIPLPPSSGVAPPADEEEEEILDSRFGFDEEASEAEEQPWDPDALPEGARAADYEDQVKERQDGEEETPSR